MTRYFEITGFVALSVALHLVLAMEIDEQNGANAGGEGGAEMVSLVAATASVETMVEQWEAPPPVVTQVAQPSRETVEPDVTPDRPQAQFDLAPDRSAAISLPSAEQDLPDMPQVDMSSPEPPRPPELKPEPEVAEPEPAPEPVEKIDEPEPQEPPEVVEEPELEERPPKTATATSRRPKQRPEHIEQAQPEPKPRKAAKPAPVAKQESAGSTAQKSAGTGGTTQAGNSGSATVATLSKAQKASLEATWGGQIRTRIERRKRSPRGARGEGRVVLRITVARSGQVLKVAVARSSGNPLFDQAALQAVSRSGKMPSAPAGLTNASYGFMLPMDFR
ncbi:TonB family protein [Sulfitobacter sp. BDSS02]|nr:TonB family protein [Sulfitobacter sp. BDSS02]MBR9852080.1 energy transducer TonB [Paracoccaceae bacterium]